MKTTFRQRPCHNCWNNIISGVETCLTATRDNGRGNEVGGHNLHPRVDVRFCYLRAEIRKKFFQSRASNLNGKGIDRSSDVVICNAVIRLAFIPKSFAPLPTPTHTPLPIPTHAASWHFNACDSQSIFSPSYISRRPSSHSRFFSSPADAIFRIIGQLMRTTPPPSPPPPPLLLPRRRHAWRSFDETFGAWCLTRSLTNESTEDYRNWNRFLVRRRLDTARMRTCGTSVKTRPDRSGPEFGWLRVCGLLWNVGEAKYTACGWVNGCLQCPLKSSATAEQMQSRVPHAVKYK